jgi:hypothetical protein
MRPVWVRRDGLAGDAVQAIDLNDGPAARGGVTASAQFMVFGTLAARLVFGRDPDPETDALAFRLFLFCAFTHHHFRSPFALQNSIVCPARGGKQARKYAFLRAFTAFYVSIESFPDIAPLLFKRIGNGGGDGPVFAARVFAPPVW